MPTGWQWWQGPLILWKPEKVIIFSIDINDPCVGIWKHWYVPRQRGPAVHRAGWTVCVQFHIMRSWDLGELTDYWLSPKNQVEQCVLHDAHCLDEKKNEHYGDHFKVNLSKAFIVANIFPFPCFLVSSDQHACSVLSIPLHLFYPFNHSGQWFHILVKTQRLLAIAQVWTLTTKIYQFLSIIWFKNENVICFWYITFTCLLVVALDLLTFTFSWLWVAPLEVWGRLSEEPWKGVQRHRSQMLPAGFNSWPQALWEIGGDGGGAGQDGEQGPIPASRGQSWSWIPENKT